MEQKRKRSFKALRKAGIPSQSIPNVNKGDEKMNIFALSKCPQESARQMIDKHVIKMPTETCQMLHTNILYMQYVHTHGKEPQLKDLKAFHQEIGSELMKPAMLNHPQPFGRGNLWLTFIGFISMARLFVKNTLIVMVKYMVQKRE